MDLYYYFLLWFCLVGLCMGSFYNVVILRSLNNESIVFPPSKCPKCGNRLKPWHNIPVISYILLRGKCYFCKEKISIQYPIIEIVTMLLFVLAYITSGLSWNTLFLIIVFSCFLIMTVTDIKEKLVDCNIAIGLAILGFVWNFVNGGINSLVSSVLGLILAVIVLELVARTGYLFIKDRAMGEADTYVAGALGALFGLQNIGWILFYGLISAMLFIIPQFLYNQYKIGNKQICVLLIAFISSAILSFNIENYYTLSLLIITGLWLSIKILKSIKTVENRNYLPYVPALVAGAMYFLYFG